MVIVYRVQILNANSGCHHNRMKLGFYSLAHYWINHYKS